MRARARPVARRRRRRNRVGVLEKRNPLPPARYWVDLIGDQQIADWFAWMGAQNADQQSIRIEATKDTPAEPTGPFSASTHQVWVLFETLRPITWQGPGWPTVAAEDVHTEADTVQRPDPWTWGGAFNDWESEHGYPLEGAGILLALWVLYEITK